MPVASLTMIASVLKELGYKVPSDKEMTVALQKALHNLKCSQGQDPDAVNYKLLSTIDVEWIDNLPTSKDC